MVRARCEACLMRPAWGVLTLEDDDGHQVAAWWTCPECADHDAPIHTARGIHVAVWGGFDFDDFDGLGDDEFEDVE
jgi:hypothetical protein